VAALRALLQLGAVSLVIVVVLRSFLWSLVFAVGMLAVGVATSAQRIGARSAWPWVALCMAAGVVPVLGIVFGLQAVPWTTSSLVAVAGIVVGGAMTASTLNGRRCYAALREEHHLYEAGLSIGLPRSEAISEIVQRRLREALVPGLDQTRTVGLVTLPGAFVGVLLGGGTPLQAGAAQVVVLCALLATQSIVVVSQHVLMRSARLLPDDLRLALRP
jgi:putative ABC transport system permease protein